MNRLLRFSAIIVLAGALTWWWAAGANRGWTKTSIPKTIVDPVTGLEGVSYESRFVPGLDILGIAVLGAVALAGGSCLFRNRSETAQSKI